MNRVLVAHGEQSVTEPLTYLLHQSGFQVVIAFHQCGRDGRICAGRGGSGVTRPGVARSGPGGLELCRELRARSAVPVMS